MEKIGSKSFNETEIWGALLELIHRQWLTKKKPKDEITTSLVQSADKVTESIEYDEGVLLSLGFQGFLHLQEFTDVTKDAHKEHQLETLIQEVKELKQAIAQITEKQPSVICTKIYSLPSSEYELKIPIDVTVEIHQDEVIAAIPDLELYGEGNNQIEALNELKLELLDLYDDLEDMTDEELGEFPKAWKKTLQQLVKKCQ